MLPCRVPCRLLLPGVLVAVLVSGSPAHAQSRGPSWPVCSDTVKQQCVAGFTVDGGSPPADVALEVFESSGTIQFQLVRRSNSDYELSGTGLTNDSLVRVQLNVGGFDAVALLTTGALQSVSFAADAAGGTSVTFEARPRSSSWSTTCTPPCDYSGAASIDYRSMFLGVVESLREQAGLPPEHRSSSGAFRNAARGSWIATNGQSVTAPTYNPQTGAFEFQVSAPHWKADGSTVNMGFFTAFLPDALLRDVFRSPTRTARRPPRWPSRGVTGRRRAP